MGLKPKFGNKLELNTNEGQLLILDESQRMQYKIRYLGHLKAGGEEHTINIPHLAEHDHSYRFFR